MAVTETHQVIITRFSALLQIDEKLKKTVQQKHGTKTLYKKKTLNKRLFN
jgi:hypothetical protein